MLAKCLLRCMLSRSGLREDRAVCCAVSASFLAGSESRRRWSTECPAGLNNKTLKTMADLPGPSFLTSLYWLFVKGYMDKTHAMQIEHKKIYGPIWKSKYGPLALVNVASADLIEQVIRQEGKYPIRTDMPHWREYRRLRSHAYGPLSELGSEWHRIRSALNPKMLKPKEVSLYAPAINKVVTEFISKVYWLREKDGSGVLVKDLANELYKFAFEGICTVLFETRMGCLEEKVPEDTQKFISAVGEMFRLSYIVMLFPKPTWPYLPIWKTFVACWDHLFKVAKVFIDKKMAAIQENVKKGEPVEGEYLTHLLASQKLSVTEIYSSITELLLGGVDTTSNTISWALYHLAQDPVSQNKLYEEVTAISPGKQIPTVEEIGKMIFLKAVIKETLRLYPVVPGNARVPSEKEVVVGGYLIPKKTLFHLCHFAASHDENDFPDPFAFQPERWMRGNEKWKHHPFSSIPFGFGVRACVGRRVAELEMYCTLSRVRTRAMGGGDKTHRCKSHGGDVGDMSPTTFRMGGTCGGDTWGIIPHKSKHTFRQSRAEHFFDSVFNLAT
uniref:Cytochrome P450 family 27 subfamily A member 3 n=1 Tax=Latimeria chalumnae TaxID=7897 RepID=M3XKF7_LATCH